MVPVRPKNHKIKTTFKVGRFIHLFVCQSCTEKYVNRIILKGLLIISIILTKYMVTKLQIIKTKPQME